MGCKKDKLKDDQLKAVNGGTGDDLLEEAAKNAEAREQENLQNQINDLEEHIRERTSTELNDLTNNILDIVGKISDLMN